MTHGHTALVEAPTGRETMSEVKILKVGLAGTALLMLSACVSPDEVADLDDRVSTLESQVSAAQSRASDAEARASQLEAATNQCTATCQDAQASAERVYQSLPK